MTGPNQLQLLQLYVYAAFTMTCTFYVITFHTSVIISTDVQNLPVLE